MSPAPGAATAPQAAPNVLRPQMRAMWLSLHRWLGLATAGFIVIAALTGAAISWGYELDRWLNPQLFNVPGEPAAEVRSPGELIEAVEKAALGVRVSLLPLQYEGGRAALLGVRPDPALKPDPTSPPPFDQVFVDPVRGRILGVRDSAQIGFDRVHLMPTLQRLHQSLLVPEASRWGLWLMGAVAFVWMCNAIIGFYLTWPIAVGSRSSVKRHDGVVTQLRRFARRWASSWRIATGAGAARITFDIHRALALWFWVLIVLQAFTGFEQDLRREVVLPVLRTLATVTPGPFDRPRPLPQPALDMSEIIVRAQAESKRRQWDLPLGSVLYSPGYGVYSARFFTAGADHTLSRGVVRQEVREIYLDGVNGRVLGDRIPWHGTFADALLQIRLPLHSGRIYGTWGQVLPTVLGLATATLTIAGVLTWLNRRPLRAKRTPAGR